MGIKFYKGSVIIMRKSINGKGAFKLDIKIYYRYATFKVRVYKHSITLVGDNTLSSSYKTIKEFIDDLDRVVKFE